MSTASDTNLNPPVLPDEVRTLQEQIASVATMVESGEKPQTAFLGFITREPEKLTVEGRFTLLGDLLKDCRRLNRHLVYHRGVLLSFFTRLATHLRELLAGKVNQVKELEYKRKKLSDVVENTQDEGLTIGVDELQQRLGRFLRIVCMGAILLLRSIEGCRKALDMLEEEERRRHEMMENLTVRINAHTQMLELEKELSDFEKNAGIGSDFRFDSYIRDYWVPFEDLVREVRSIDEKLRSAADEIVELAKTLEAARPGDVPFASTDEMAVDHLLYAEGDPATIWNVVQNDVAMDQASAGVDVALAFGKEPSFDRALKNIETLVHSRLEDCFGDELNRARSLNTPEAWANYLARYPASAGAHEARLNLRKMEDDALTKARGTSGVWDAVPLWRRFLEQFPIGQNATEAQESIQRFRAETLSSARNAPTPHDARGAWHAFAVLFPDRTAEESREFQEGMHGALVRCEPTPKRWRDYLASCPDGPLAREAKEFTDAYAWVPNWAVAWGMDSVANGRCWAELEVKEVRQRFRLIEPDVFLMGSPAEEKGEQNETPQHEVTLTKAYWIAETECTQALWKAVTGSNPSKFQEDNRPVDSVSWEDCILFLNKLSELIPELEARLPTEAEWECACRAGTSAPYAGLWQEMAWASENAGGETHAVKQRQPNAWGLYDMQGNVAEWLSDDLRTYANAKCIDPVGPPPSVKAGHRGGSWNWGVTNTRSAARNSLYRDVRGPEQGLRIAVSASRNESGWVFHATGGADIDWLSKPPDHGIFLGELKAQRVTGAYAPTVNDAWGVRSCLIAGRTCTTFVTVHPPGEFAWPIPPHAFQFATVLARVDIVQAFHASWSYQFLIDGKVVFKSPPLSERRNGIPLVLDIPHGARRLTVITDPLGDNQYDHAILAWPYFRMRPVLELLACIPDEAIFPGDLTFTKHHFGGLEFRSFKNSSAGDAVPIAGKPVTTYLDVHAPASITYEIPDQAIVLPQSAPEGIGILRLKAHGNTKFGLMVFVYSIRRLFTKNPKESPSMLPFPKKLAS